MKQVRKEKVENTKRYNRRWGSEGIREIARGPHGVLGPPNSPIQTACQ